MMTYFPTLHIHLVGMMILLLLLERNERIAQCKMRRIRRRKRKCTRYVLMKDVPTMLFKEEYVLNMAQSVHLLRYAVTKDVQTMTRKEGYVSDMVQKEQS